MATPNRKLLALAAVAATLAGCDETGLAPSPGTQLSLSFAVAEAAPGARMALVPVTDDEGRTLDIERAEILVREVELKLDEDDHCEEEDDACEKFVAGPLLIDLPLEGGVVTPFTEPVAPGSYRELEMRIKEPEDDNGDRARFRAEHPEWPRKATVRVRGTFDAGDGAGAQPFDVFLAVDAKIEREFDPPLEVGTESDPGDVEVVLTTQVSDWFRSRDGELIDPRSAVEDRDLAERVEESLERSFRASRDDDGGRGRGRGRGRGGRG